MAFNSDYLARVSTSGNTGALTVWIYNGTSTGSNDTLATVTASGYFDSFQQNLTAGDESGPLKADDLMFLFGNDGNGTYKVSSVTTNVTVAASQLTPASVGNDELEEDTIQYAEVDITTAEVKALAASPKELVAAPGADKYLMFLGATFILDYNSVAYTEAGDNLAVKYTDDSGVQVSETVESTGFIDQTADTLTNAVPKKDGIVAASGAVNKPLVLDNLGSEFAAGDSPLTVQVVYRVVTANL